MGKQVKRRVTVPFLIGRVMVSGTGIIGVAATIRFMFNPHASPLGHQGTGGGWCLWGWGWQVFVVVIAQGKRPVSIPNLEAKPCSGEGTSPGRVRENSTLPQTMLGALVFRFFSFSFFFLGCDARGEGEGGSGRPVVFNPTAGYIVLRVTGSKTGKKTITN